MIDKHRKQFLVALLGPAIVATMAAAQAQTNVNITRGGNTARSGAVTKASSNSDSSQQRQSETSSTISVSEGDTKAEITSKVRTYLDAEGNEKREEKKETRVFVAGKEIPANRVRQASGMLQVLDESGEVIRTISLPDVQTAASAGGSAGGSAMSGGTARASGSIRRALSGLSGSTTSGRGANQVQPLDGTVNIAAPKVMLGITMEVPDGALANHLRVQPESVTKVGTVTPDTPAAKAGLQQYDIIVSVDGSKPASPARLREVLRGKEPGQTLNLGVFSGGAQKELTITLEPYDRVKLGVSEVHGQPMIFSFDDGEPGSGTINEEKLKELVEQMQSQMGNELDLDWEAVFAPFEPSNPDLKGNSFYRFRVPPAQATPAPQSGATDGAEARVRELEARIQSLTETIKRLEEKLNAAAGAPGKGA